MILEFAHIAVRSGSEAQFEHVFPSAIRHLAGSAGYVSHRLHRSLEAPNRYVLIVEWRTLEDHTQGFRRSPAFAEWRSKLAPFLERPPVVEHFERTPEKAD